MNNTSSEQIAIEKEEAARLDMLVKVAKVNKIKALGKTTAYLTIEQLKILITLLRRHKEKKISVKKEDLLFRLVEWEGQGGIFG